MRPYQLCFLATAVVARVLHRAGGPKAVYFLDNNPGGSSIVSLEVDGKGMLARPVRTSTGGVGMYSVRSSGTPAMQDTLLSQDAVVVVGDRLFTVNTGSNTIAMFSIPASDPSKPVLQATAPSGGSFPNSIAYSQVLHMACVVNTGNKPGVMCYHVTHDNRLEAAGDFMSLSDAIMNTTPPVGPPGTASDIVFNPSSSALFVSIKGDGMTPGYIYAYPVVGSKVSAEPVVSRPAELLVDFSVSFLDDTRAVITDPSYGASFVDIRYPALEVTGAKKVAVPNQGATCWSVYSDRFDAVFIFDGGNANTTTLSPNGSGETKYVIPGPAGAMGNFDSAVSGEFLYVLHAKPSVSVYSLAGSVGNHMVPKPIQTLDLSGLGSRQGWQGMAIYH